MKTDVQKPDKLTESAPGSANEFNFDQWVQQVRPQLLASLSKRGVRY